MLKHLFFYKHDYYFCKKYKIKRYYKMGKKKFVEKVYFKVVYDGTNVVNGVGNLLVTFPQTQSFILTTKETGSKFLKEKPDTVVTEITYITLENTSLLGSPNIWNVEKRVQEKDSFVSYVTTEVFPGGINNLLIPEARFTAPVSASIGRFAGATKVKSVVLSTSEGGIITRTHNVSVIGYR
jgi:hypothetical protein